MSVATIGAVDYAKALDGLSLKQAQLMLTTQGMLGEEQKDLLVKQGLIATSDRMSASLVAEALADNGLNKELQDSILIRAQLMNQETKGLITENAVTEAKLRAILAEKGIKGAKADTLIASILQTGQNAKEAVSWKVLASSIKEAGIALLTNPVAWIAGAIVLVGALVKGYDALIGKQEELARAKIEGLTEDISEYDAEINSLIELQSKLESAKGNKAELAKIQTELNDAIGNTPGLLNGEAKAWNAANVKIQANIDLLKQQREEAQQNKINASKELFDNNTYEIDWGFDITGDQMRNIMPIYQEYIDTYKKMDEESIKWAETLYGDIENAEDYAFKRLQYEGIQIGDGITYNASLNKSDWEEYWREQVDVAYDVFEDTIDTYDGVGGQSFLKNLITNMVMGGSDLSEISTAITHVIENEDIQNAINDYWESLVDPNIDSEKALNKVRGVFDSIVEQFPELATFFDDFYNQIATSGFNAASSVAENTNDIIASLEQLNEALDKIQSAYKTVESAIEEYNKQGYLSVDTYQSLMELEPQYLHMLMDENGNLNLNTEAVLDNTKAYIQNLGIKAATEMVDKLATKYSDEASQLDFLTGALNANTDATWDNVYSKLYQYKTEGKITDTVYDAAITKIDAYKKMTESAMAGVNKNGLSDAEKDFKQLLDNEINLLEKQLEAGIITFEEYTDKRKAIIKQYYEDGLITAEEYYSALEDMYDHQLSIMDKIHDTVIKRFDKEIESIEKEIDKLEKSNELLEEQKNEYDRVLGVIESVYDKEIERIQEEQNLIDDTIKKLQEENDESKRAIELEKERGELERLRSNRRKKIYTGENGYVYDVDHSAIRDAQDNLADLELEQTINALEKEKESLDATIEELEKYKELWGEISDAKEDAENKMLASSILGANYEQIILANRTEDIEAFKDNYIAVQEQIDDNTSLIESYEEKVVYYENLKEQWQAITDTFTEEQNELLTAQFFGEDWEAKILSGRLEELQKFNQEYYDIQQAQVRMAEEAAKAIIEAEKEKQKGADGDVDYTTLTPPRREELPPVTYKPNSTTDAYEDAQAEKFGKVGSSSVSNNDTISKKYQQEEDRFNDDALYVPAIPKIKTGNPSWDGGTYYDYVKWYLYKRLPNMLNKTMTADEYLEYVGVEKYHNGLDSGYVSSKFSPLSDDDRLRMFQRFSNGKLKPEEIPALLKYGELVMTPEQQENIARNMQMLYSRNIVQYSLPKGVKANNNTTPVVQNINLTLPNVTNNSGYERLQKELKQMQIDALQIANKR